MVPESILVVKQRESIFKTMFVVFILRVLFCCFVVLGGSKRLMMETSTKQSESVVYAMLDKVGEYETSLTSTYNEWLTVIGLIILLIPTLWCLMGSIMMARKLIKLSFLQFVCSIFL